MTTSIHIFYISVLNSHLTIQSCIVQDAESINKQTEIRKWLHTGISYTKPQGMVQTAVEYAGLSIQAVKHGIIWGSDQ
jgi:hypothetical protein